jgi:hypothetical protein
MDSATVIRLLWYANTAATLGLLISLLKNRLAGVYRWFWCYLFVSFAESAMRIPLRDNSRASANIYMATRAVGVIIAVLLMMELYRLALAAHPALARYGRRAVGYLLAIAYVLAGATLLLPVLGPRHSRIMYYFFAFERTAASAVMVFLLLASVFMIWFPVRISKNVSVFIGGFVVYFITRWAGLVGIGVRLEFLNLMNVMMLALQLTCLVAWIALLRPEGETESTVLGHRWNPLEMERLTGQLAAINAKLEKVSGKSGYISLQS